MISDRIKNGADLSWHLSQSYKENKAVIKLCDIIVEESKINPSISKKINLLISEIDEEEVIRY